MNNQFNLNKSNKKSHQTNEVNGHEKTKESVLSLRCEKRAELFRLKHRIFDLRQKYELLKKTEASTKADAEHISAKILKCRQFIWNKRNYEMQLAMKFHAEHNWDRRLHEISEENSSNKTTASVSNGKKVQLKIALKTCEAEIGRLQQQANLQRELLEVQKLENELLQLRSDAERIAKQARYLETEIHKLTTDIRECKQIQGLLHVDDVNIEMEVNVNIKVTRNEKLRSILKNRDFTEYIAREKTPQPSRKRIKFTDPMVTRTILISPNRKQSQGFFL